jgi:hypothetical protein
VLKQSKELVRDCRKRFDGTPLRQSWALPFLSRPTSLSSSEGTFYCLYEAQTSVAITGIDHSVWTAYGFFDSYFESRESIDAYNQWKSRSSRLRLDPLAADQISTINTIWTPREYFFKVFEIRISEVRRQWHAISEKIEEELNQYVYFLHFVTSILWISKLDLEWETRTHFVFSPFIVLVSHWRFRGFLVVMIWVLVVVIFEAKFGR